MRSETSPSSSSRAAPKERWLKHLLLYTCPREQWCHDPSTDQYLLKQHLTVAVRFLFPIRPFSSSCWRPSGLWPGRSARCWRRARARRRPPGSSRSLPGASSTSPRWRSSQSCWWAAPVSASLWWRFWLCCLESAWWWWSRSTSETGRSGGGQEMVVLRGLMLGRGVLSFYRLLSDSKVLEWRLLLFLAVGHLSDLCSKLPSGADVSVKALNKLFEPLLTDASILLWGQTVSTKFHSAVWFCSCWRQQAKFKYSFSRNTPPPLPFPPFLCLMLEMTFLIMFFKSRECFFFSLCSELLCYMSVSVECEYFNIPQNK